MHPDPSTGLVTAFRAAATRMRGLAFVNPNLDVAAIGFAPWSGHWLGVLLTPWFMNLVLAPREPDRWIDVAPGATRHYAFPAGDFEFIGARDDAVGVYQMCSLFSPVQEIADQETALLVAQLARDALFDAANAPAHAMPAGVLTPPAEPRHRALEEKLATPMSRRDLLRGRFVPPEHDPRG